VVTAGAGRTVHDASALMTDAEVAPTRHVMAENSTGRILHEPLNL